MSFAVFSTSKCEVTDPECYGRASVHQFAVGVNCIAFRSEIVRGGDEIRIDYQFRDFARIREGDAVAAESLRSQYSQFFLCGEFENFI